MKIARDKGSALVIAGSKSAQELNGDEVVDSVEVDNIENDSKLLLGEDDALSGAKSQSESQVVVNTEGKRRLSKAERKRMKKDPNYKPYVTNNDDVSKKSKGKRGTDFRDNLNFIENDVTHDTAAAARSRQMEAAMQPSAASSSKGSAALAYRIEGDMLDIVGDENIDLVKQQRMMRWDKRRF